MDSNSTNATITGLPVASLVCSWISLIVLIIPAAVVNSFSLVNLIFDVKLAKSVRISLSNILIGCLLVAISGTIKYTSGLVTGYNNLSSSETLCHFTTWLYFIGQAARPSFMALLAVVVFILTKQGEPTKTRKGKTCLFVANGTVWLLVGTISGLSFSSQVVRIYFVEEILCHPVLNPTPLGYFTTAIYFSLFGLFSFALTIVMGIAGVIFVKRSTFSDDNRSLKAITKFVFFVLIGNTVSVIAQLLPLILRSVDLEQDLDETITAQYITSFITYISLLPTPILFLAYFKPTGRNLKTFKQFACNLKKSRYH